MLVLILQRQARDVGGSAPVFGLQQLDLAFHHIGCRGCADRIDIGLVDQLQRQVAAPEPHWHWGSLDQADQRREIARGPCRRRSQARHFRVAFGKIEHPYQCRSARRDLRIGQRAVERKAALRSRQVDRHAERGRAFLGGLDLGPKLVELISRKPAAPRIAGRCGQFAEVFRHGRKAERTCQPVRRFDPPVHPHQQRQRGRNVHQRLHPLETGLERLGPLHPAIGAQDDQRSARRPCGKYQRDQHKRERRSVHRVTAMRAAPPAQR